MSEYIVTITPVTGDDEDGEPRSQMTVRVELSDGEPHIVELTVRAPAGADLASGQLPSIDLERLAQVFGPPTATGGLVRTRAATIARPGRRPAGRRAVAARQAEPQVEARGEGDVTGARAYRRMPDPAELQKVYGDIGSIAGVAKHYGVPTHTAQGWIGRLRRQGASTARQ